jgi:hypothetical protein
MTPEIAIERVRGFVRWCSEKFEHLDGQHGAITDPLGWRRGAEFWVPSATWHDIFDNDEDAALIAAQALHGHGLLRTQSGPSLQCYVKIRKEVRRCYCVSEKILTWKPPSRGSNGSNPAQSGLPYGHGIFPFPRRQSFQKISTNCRLPRGKIVSLRPGCICRRIC